MAYIYKILNVVTDDFYFGSSVNFKKRKWEHLNMLKKNEHHCKKLQIAWNEYGPDAFEFEVVEEVLDEDALRIEDTYLAQYAGTALCYNTAFTSMQSPSETQIETRAKISETLTELYKQGYAPRVGKLHSVATKEKISAAKLANPSRYWLGKQRTAETKEKISAAQLGKSKSPGRKVSEEGRKKIRANIEAGRSHKHWTGRTHTEESKAKMSKRIIELTSNTEFASLSDALAHYGLKMPTLRRALILEQPITKGPHAGLCFKYLGMNIEQKGLHSTNQSVIKQYT